MGLFIRQDIFLHRLLFVLIALLSFFIRLMPLGQTAGSWPAPDILICIIFAWILRRPDYMPILLIAAVIFTEDVLLMRPPGLATALVIIGSEIIRSRIALMREFGFMMEWFFISLLLTAIFMIYHGIFTIAFLPPPNLSYMILYLIGTVLIYPPIVWLSKFVLGVHKPGTGERDHQGRRL